MRPLLVAWLEAHGLPGELAPGYVACVVAAAFVCSAVTLRLARRDGADPHREARTIAVVYVCAVAGGALFEALRALPAAVAAGSLEPLAHAGLAAWGGVLFAAGGAFLYLRRAGAPVAPFFDRAAVGTGLAFALVRTGCFLAGCDYGLPTANMLGVRFPAGSLAAEDHLARGFTAPGAPSLPVHPTELYEAALGLAAAALAWRLLRNPRRDGRVFAATLAVYSAGRFALEWLRGDEARGRWLALSTAQWTSLAVLAAIALFCARGAAFGWAAREQWGRSVARRADRCC